MHAIADWLDALADTAIEDYPAETIALVLWAVLVVVISVAYWVR